MSPTAISSAGPRAARFRWPDDYAALEEGRLFVARPILPMLKQQGLDRLDALTRMGEAEVFHRRPDRSCATLHLSDGQGGQILGYLKRHEARALPEEEGPALHEARISERLREAGVATIEVLAAGQSLPSDGPMRRSVLLTRAVDGEPAERYWRRRFAHGGTRDERRAVLAALGEAVRRMHAAGLYHRDCYWCHFLVADTDDGVQVSVIDLQRVLDRPRRPWRWRFKDVAQFRFSAPPECVSRAELDYWWRCYLRRDRLAWHHRLIWMLLGLRAAIYRWREGPQ